MSCCVLDDERFKVFVHSLFVFNFNLQSLVSLFRVASQQAWTSSSEVAVDESTIPHPKPKDHEQLEATRRGDPIPHHYIPRKPHPNCLLVWVMATKSTKTGLPFLLDASFDFFGVSGRNACAEFVRNWTYKHPPHFIVDAAITGMFFFLSVSLSFFFSFFPLLSPSSSFTSFFFLYQFLIF
jgi:hypothetical protein